jgi:hypothetical protein
VPLIQGPRFNSTAVNLLFSSHFGSRIDEKLKPGHATGLQAQVQRAAIVASTTDWASAQGHGGERTSVNVDTCSTQEQRAAKAGVSYSAATVNRLAKMAHDASVLGMGLLKSSRDMLKNNQSQQPAIMPYVSKDVVRQIVNELEGEY